MELTNSNKKIVSKQLISTFQTASICLNEFLKLRNCKHFAIIQLIELQKNIHE